MACWLLLVRVALLKQTFIFSCSSQLNLRDEEETKLVKTL